jgi:hypothetical protein
LIDVEEYERKQPYVDRCIRAKICPLCGGELIHIPNNDAEMITHQCEDCGIPQNELI